MFLRQEYDKAISLLKSSIEMMLKYSDYGYTSGAAITLADIYLRTGNLAESKKYIDLADDYYRKVPRETTLPRIYEAMSNYYAMVGNGKLSMAYMDSTLRTIEQLEKQYSAMLLLRMEQKESAQQQQSFEMEKAMKEQHIAKQNIRLRLLSFILILSLLMSGMLVYFYRKQQEKNRGLYRQIKEQDYLAEELKLLKQQNTEGDVVETHCNASLQGNIQQRQLVARFCEYLHENKFYTRIEINIDEIVSALATNRTDFFKAIKTVTNKTPIEYINSVRLEEAKQILETNFDLSLEAIAYDYGFGSYTTFYRLFKERYQISPLQYRKIAKTSK
jgi:AraC-like DNA-binding protein